jgi:hypothetical protein
MYAGIIFFFYVSTLQKIISKWTQERMSGFWLVDAYATLRIL